MIIAAIDLATDRMSVAARTLEGREAERHLTGARGHARALVPLLEECLDVVGGGVADIERMIVADGPGSFTGLRVAATLAKGLARAGAVAVAVTPSLLGRAARAAGGKPGTVLAATSALRGEVYAGWYQFSPGKVVTALVPATARDWDQVAAGPAPDLVAGDAPDGFLEALGRHWRVPVAGREDSQADARVLLGLDQWAGGTVVVEAPADWEPIYGRPAEAQAKWEREHGRPLPDSPGTPG